MGGGLMQLVSYGAQDIYISGNPQITFWKVLYKRHTNFAMECRRVNFQGFPSWGTKVSTMIPRYADMMHHTYLYVELPGYDYWAVDSGFDSETPYTASYPMFGYKLFDYIELEIGGNVIDKQYGLWMYLWQQLTHDFTKVNELSHMTTPYEDSPSLYNAALNPSKITTTGTCAADGTSTALYIPLTFWFAGNPGLAIPLIALQYHEVRLNVQMAPAVNVTTKAAKSADAPPQLLDAALLIDYVYLDTEERRRFAQQSHEYLITQVQFSEPETIKAESANIDLTLNHPVKELVWIMQPEGFVNCGLSGRDDGRLFVQSGLNYIKEAQLQLNGQERFEYRRGDYFQMVQPNQHHTGTIPLYGLNGVYVYSFALKPEEHQPSGTCNFSRIDKATLLMKLVPSSGFAGIFDQDKTPSLTPVFSLFAVNYNVLRIMSGMAGLAYSN